ncbi:MAG: hypothetical protein J6J42_02685 [Lachnospiraceae bacterium]|nr:hypothetical protein [Lachnospiraceae bacterium]MBP3609226.1 hypothetical protein [Lachnospiraceae bacterium]
MEEKNDKQEKTDKKRILLMYAGSLIFYSAFGVILVKLFQMNVENIWMEGFQIGLISWLVVMVLPLFIKKKKR